MINESGLRPLGVAVLVKPFVLERPAGAMIAIPAHVQGPSAAIDNRARVVAIGPSAWKDEGFWKPILWGLWRRWVQIDRAKVGDLVLITKYAGFVATGQDENVYRLVNDRDVFCALEGEQA